jgi:cytoskeletal protein RodZ
MNHTIKGIIIVAAITSMLVVGASMIPIMQNASARSTNTNSNTNTADSSSSSDATASNTNNINNTATASNSQDQDARAVAVTCPEGSTTVTPPPTSPCNPSTVGGQTATPNDGTCRATIPFSAGDEAVAFYESECARIPDSRLVGNLETREFTCTFPSTPPT